MSRFVFLVMQFFFIQSIEGAITDKGLSLSLDLIDLILLTDCLFVASQPIP